MADLDRRIEQRTDLVVLDDLARLGAQLRREVDQVVVGQLLDLERLRVRRVPEPSYERSALLSDSIILSTAVSSLRSRPSK